MSAKWFLNYENRYIDDEIGFPTTIILRVIVNIAAESAILNYGELAIAVSQTL